MNRKDLKFPFKWEERKPLILDKVFFVPSFYDRHEPSFFPSLENDKVFGRFAQTYIEYCSGNGAWIIEKAKKHSDWNWIAVEKKFNRVQKIWSKAKQFQLENIFIVCGEALTFTTHYLPTDSIDEIYINFPDPWPKEKHTKNRLIQGKFLEEMARISKMNAKAVIVTDYLDYAVRISKEMSLHSQWTPVFPHPHFVTEWEDYGTSFFEQLWREKGRTIHYLQFSNHKLT